MLNYVQVQEEDEPAVTVRYDRAMFEAALAYLGLPEDYERLLAKDPAHASAQGASGSNQHRGLTPLQATLEEAAARGQLLWVQINEPGPGCALTPQGWVKKATTGDILVMHNVALDFEYPPSPPLVHTVGLELARRLVERGLAGPGLPVEDSGAGCHLVLPIRPIVTTEVKGGAYVVNEAVRAVVKTHIEPLYSEVLDRYWPELAAGPGRPRLEGFDISHLLSQPGTWRPSHKPGEAAYLRAGYVRRWLPPYTGTTYPARVESQDLTALILATARQLRMEQAHQETETEAAPPASGAAGWNEEGGPALGRTDSRSRTECYVSRAVLGEVARVVEAPPGQGNNALNIAAFKLGRLVGAGVLDRYTVESRLEYAATSNGRRSSREARATIRSGLVAGMVRPRAAP